MNRNALSNEVASLNQTTRAFRAEDDKEIMQAVHQQDVTRAAKLAKRALRDRQLPLKMRVKYEALLTLLPGRDGWMHLHNAEEALRVLVDSVHRDEPPNPINVRCVEAMQSYLDQRRAKLLAKCQQVDAKEADVVDDESKTHDHNVLTNELEELEIK
ncbi:uncharacterized protein BKA78DRAFT_353583 [Phyllosticta capitalensis]|uniref:Uncharacterized protein n=1 Tax=Phyllosticta capitalensis TaxID=121624 RepID=A0ABR1YN75_9PEZI